MVRPPVRLIAFLGPFLAGVMVASGTLQAADSLANIVRPLLPKGWTLTEKADEVVLERAEKVGLYNALSLPRFNSEKEKRAYVKPNVRYEKLVIYLRLGVRMEPAEVQRIKANQDEAVQRARRDLKEGKFMPDAEFWKKHPEYGYLNTPTPILDTGTHGVYMKCPSHGVVPPTAGPRLSGRSPAYFDQEVGEECQSVIDKLAKLYTPY